MMMFSDKELFWGLFVPLAAVFVLVGVGLAFGLPWLWELVKPWLHQVTA